MSGAFDLSRQDRDRWRRIEEAAAKADTRSLRRRSVPDERVRADGEVDLRLCAAQTDARHCATLTFADRCRGGGE